MSYSCNIWDLLLIIFVSIQTIIISYVYSPEGKAIAMSFPTTFTFATLSLGNEINTTNVLGLILLFFFIQGIRIMHQKVNIPIIPAIGIGIIGYCSIASFIVQRIPSNDLFFWVTSFITIIFGILLYKIIPCCQESGHRTELSIWLKVPIIISVIIFVVLIKKNLSGFMTTFPMVGVITCYEARKSLWTVGRLVPVLILSFVPVMVFIRISQQTIGLGSAIVIGWLIFFCIFIPLTIYNGMIPFKKGMKFS